MGGQPFYNELNSNPHLEIEISILGSRQPFYECTLNPYLEIGISCPAAGGLSNHELNSNPQVEIEFSCPGEWAALLKTI